MSITMEKGKPGLERGNGERRRKKGEVPKPWGGGENDLLLKE